jgi:Peptidase inhibitor family I36
MLGLTRRFIGNRRNALIAATVPLMAAGVLLTGSALAPASAAPQAAQVSAAPQSHTVAAANPCGLPGDLCFWVNIGWGGAKGHVAGNNGNWAVFPQAQCAGGTWNDCASSAFNDGNFDAVRLRQDVNGGGGFFCIPKGVGYSNFTRLAFSNGANLNDAVSSNYWQGTANC